MSKANQEDPGADQFGTYAKNFISTVKGQVPMNVATTVLFLAHGVTGVALPVDGGYLAQEDIPL